MHPAFSPDGARLAFASDRAGQMNIWVMPIVGADPAGPAVALTSGTDFDLSPWWSPDGRSIVFSRMEAQSVGLWLVAADRSQPPRRLASTNSPEKLVSRWVAGGLFSAARWGDDGVSLCRLDPLAGRATPLHPPLVLNASLFDVSRDGSLVAFDDRPTRGDIWVLEGGPASRR